MEQNLSGFTNSVFNKIIFWSSTVVSAFWLLAKNVNVYRYALTGAISEILVLPMVGLLFLLPLLALIFLWKDRFNLRSLCLYAVLLMSVTILLTVFNN
jgi:hypothetical protein